jgi:hypothetical protein
VLAPASAQQGREKTDEIEGARSGFEMRWELGRRALDLSVSDASLSTSSSKHALKKKKKKRVHKECHLAAWPHSPEDTGGKDIIHEKWPSQRGLE